MTTDTEREAFEAWCSRQPFKAERYGVGYHDTKTNRAWLAWQARASLAAPAQPLTEAQERARRLVGDWHEGLEQCEFHAWCCEAAGILLNFSSAAPAQPVARTNEQIVEAAIDTVRRAQAELRAPPAAQPVAATEPKPDMFWNDADPERSRGSIFQIVDDAFGDGSVSFGDVMTIQQAIRLPNVQVRIVPMADDPEYPDYEFVAAAPSVAPSEPEQPEQPLGDASKEPTP
jgi:hypothetical protein